MQPPTVAVGALRSQQRGSILCTSQLTVIKKLVCAVA